MLYLRRLSGCLKAGLDLQGAADGAERWQSSGPTKQAPRPPPPSPSRLPLAACSLGPASFPPPRSLEILEDVQADRPSSPGSPTAAGHTAADERRAVFAAGQHRRNVSSAQRRRERKRVAREQRDHMNTLEQLGEIMRVRGLRGDVGRSGASHGPSQQLAVPRLVQASGSLPDSPFKLTPIFGAAPTTEMVPLHNGLQPGAPAHATAAAPVQPAGTAALAAFAPAESAGSTSGSATLQSATSQLAEPCAGSSSGGLWAPASSRNSSCGSMQHPPAVYQRAAAAHGTQRAAAFMAAGVAAEGSASGAAALPAAVSSTAGSAGAAHTQCSSSQRQARSSAVSEEMPVETTPSFLAFIQSVQLGSSDGSTAGSAPVARHPATSPTAAFEGPGSSAEQQQPPSPLDTNDSEAELLPHGTAEDYSIPTAQYAANASGAGGMQQQQQQPLLAQWRQALHSRLPHGRTTAAGGKQLAEAAVDVQPKAQAVRRHLAAGRVSATRASADENAPMVL